MIKELGYRILLLTSGIQSKQRLYQTREMEYVNPNLLHETAWMKQSPGEWGPFICKLGLTVGPAVGLVRG